MADEQRYIDGATIRDEKIPFVDRKAQEELGRQSDRDAQHDAAIAALQDKFGARIALIDICAGLSVKENTAAI